MYVYYKYTYIIFYVQQISNSDGFLVFGIFFLVALSKKVKIYDNTINREGHKEWNVYLI